MMNAKELRTTAATAERRGSYTLVAEESLRWLEVAERLHRLADRAEAPAATAEKRVVLDDMSDEQKAAIESAVQSIFSMNVRGSMRLFCSAFGLNLVEALKNGQCVPLKPAAGSAGGEAKP